MNECNAPGAHSIHPCVRPTHWACSFATLFHFARVELVSNNNLVTRMYAYHLQQAQGDNDSSKEEATSEADFGRTAVRTTRRTCR